MATPLLLPYIDTFFVNRIRELEKVREFLHNIIDKSSLRSHILLLAGERGSGKTWFSLHLHRTYLQEEFSKQWEAGKLASFLVCLSPSGQESVADNEIFIPELLQSSQSSSIDQIVNDILRKLSNYINALNPDKASLYDRTSWIVHALHQKRREEESFVLLVDSIFEANPALVKKLELHLLSPLTELPNAAIILTGRGSVPVWETPELRVKTEEIIWLTKFEINVVTEQLTKLSKTLSIEDSKK
ncbi:MAG: hypothetical protein R2932_19075 [Caldilineaceae bacterium]